MIDALCAAPESADDTAQPDIQKVVVVAHSHRLCAPKAEHGFAHGVEAEVALQMSGVAHTEAADKEAVEFA